MRFFTGFGPKEKNAVKVLFQALCVALIAAASIVYIRSNRRPLRRKATRGQYMLVFFQIILCGSYFVLCLSDYLAVRTGPDRARMISDMIYILMFLTWGVYSLFLSRLNSDMYIRGTLAVFAALTAAQCFIFPEDAPGTAGKIVAQAGGALVTAALIASLLRIRSASFVRMCMIGIVALELGVAVWSLLSAARLSADEPRRYAAFFMRTALFSTLALDYRVWLDRRGIPIRREKPADSR